MADLNRNGHAEIIVTSVVEDDLRSFIIEYEEGKFRKITEKAGWYFRVLEHPKEGPILMGQKMGSEGIFVGPIYKFVWKKKSFEKGPKMALPKEQKSSVLLWLISVEMEKRFYSFCKRLHNVFSKMERIVAEQRTLWGDKQLL